MGQTGWDRRDVLWGLSAIAGAGILGARVTPATAQQVKYSSGTEPPRLKAPANACDCHHHIYGSQYKVDPRSTLRRCNARRTSKSSAARRTRNCSHRRRRSSHTEAWVR